MLSAPTVPPHLEPYALWSFGAGKDYAFPSIRDYDVGEALSILIEASDPIPTNAADNWFAAHGDTTLRHPLLWQGDGTFATHFIPSTLWLGEGRTPLAGDADALATTLGAVTCTAPGGDTLETRFTLNIPVPQSSGRALGPLEPLPNRAEKPPLPKNLTVIGVIEDAIPFANRAFLDGDGHTRVDYCWLQAAPEDASTPRVRVGRELLGADIDDLRVRLGHDEVALYREAGAATPHPRYGVSIERHATHGSLVMDVAAGHTNPAEADDAVRIIAVQLPNVVAWDTSSFGKEMYMVAAVHYILERADHLRRQYAPKLNEAGEEVYDPLPVVINFSYGFSGGPHGGSETGRTGLAIEDALDEMVAARRAHAPTAMVLPSGNTFSDRLHAVLPLSSFVPGETTKHLRWRLQPNDRTSNFLELWFPAGVEEGEFSVALTQPDGSSLGVPVMTSSPGETAPPGTIGQMTMDRHRGTRLRVMIALAPTEPEPIFVEGAAPRVPAAAAAGVWTVAITHTAGALGDGAILAYIQRDDEPTQLKSGARQSYFDAPAFALFGEDGAFGNADAPASAVKRFGTLNGLGTGATTTVVAGYRPTARAAYVATVGVPENYSSAGPLAATPTDASVDASAQTSGGRAMPGMMAAGVLSGSRGRMAGTSVAAPQVARWIAHALASGEGPAKDEWENTAAYAALVPGVRVATGAPGGFAAPTVRLGAVFATPTRPTRASASV
ncbi:MAG: hypothetical protein AAF318_06505 [Pseudomonadota bacterium]